MTGLSNNGAGLGLNGALTLGANRFSLNANGTSVYGQGFTLFGAATGAEVVDAWIAAVKLNGGTVSAARRLTYVTYVTALIAAGCWQLLDDVWILCAEDTAGALTSLKQLRLATAVAAPTFTVDGGYAFNGTTQYINTNFVASTHCRAATLTNARVAVYERTNVSASTYAVGGQSSSSRSLAIRPRVAGDAFGGAQSQQGTWTLGAADSRGYTSVSRAASTTAMYKNGVALTNTVAPTLSTGSLPGAALYIGALNSSGALTSPRAATEGAVEVGAAFTAAQELAAYTALQTYMTAIGANV